MLRQGLPPAARFLLRGRNRGKSAAGAPPLHPGAAGAEAKGAQARRGRSGWYMRLSSADLTAGNARLLFRVLFAAPAQGRPVPWLPLGEAGAERLMREHNEQICSYHGYDPFSLAASPVRCSFSPDVCLRRPRGNGPHRLPRRRKSHGLRIRGCRKSRECLFAFDCSSSSNRSIRFDLRYGGYGQRKGRDHSRVFGHSSSPNRSRGFGLGNGGGGRKTLPIYR